MRNRLPAKSGRRPGRPYSCFVAALIGALGCDPSGFLTPAVSEAQREPLVVTHRDLAPTLLLTGELEAVGSIELAVPRTDSWQIALRWLADDGAPLKKGDKVVEFDNTAVLEQISDRDLAVVQAANDLIAAMAAASVEVEDKAFALETARIELAKAELDASVPVELISRREFREFDLAQRQAKAALALAKDDLKVAKRGGKSEIAVKRITLAKAERKFDAAQAEIDALEVTAPRDGVVVVGLHPWQGRKFQVGDNVSPGMTVATLPDLSQMRVRVQLSDVDDGRIFVGMRVVCTVDAFPNKPVTGLIKLVSPVATTPERGSPRRFFSVEIELDETDSESMRPGLSVKIEVETARKDNVLVAPRAGLDTSVSPTLARLASGADVEVELGTCDALGCAVLSGLEDGALLRRIGETG